MENTFATFEPIQLNSTPSREEISEYYKTNNIVLDDNYLNNLFGLNKPAPLPIATMTGGASTYNIKEILSKAGAKATAPPTITPSVPMSSPKSKAEFLKIYGPSAEAASQETGISKELLLAQVALETGWGAHTPGNNVGGIKANKSWKGKSQNLKTKEQGESGYVDAVEPFRVYDSPQEGFKGYVDFLTSNKRYKNLKGVTDPYEAAKLMAASGYATDKDYGPKLQNIITQILKANI